MARLTGGRVRSSRARATAICAVAIMAFGLAGCLGRSPQTTGSIDPRASAPLSEDALRGHAQSLAERNAADPNDARTAIAYASVLRRLDQRAQAVAVLQTAAIRNGGDMELMGAYGRALADVGRLEEAEAVLARAHLPERPDWRILSAQGTVADQRGDHARAQGFYEAALRIQPDEPGVLSNLGLSLALTNRLGEAEATLTKAAADPLADQRVRQNLALVYGLQGKFKEAESVLARDLSPAEVASSMDSIRAMVSQQNSWNAIRQADAGERAPASRN